ncbi:hypothetical protein FOL47_011055 [Perkinsus chesapeaki]|uniref:Uncharacterized protein n=1 Tax=Perkinsus chesapeaki TaxID=330153 RepID=A0A7J6KZ75_PERCH|nr:hypothetical protein FOL47_011055 [Perkinsus chesapeaki]
MRPASAGSLSSHARRSSGHHASRAAADSAMAAEREAQIDSLVKRLADQRQIEQDLRIDLENLEAERSREAEEARGYKEKAEGETREWQKRYEEAMQQIERVKEDTKKREEEQAGRAAAANREVEARGKEIERLRRDLRDVELRLQNESRERTALARALHSAEDRLAGAEVQTSQLRMELDEICRENTELKERYMTVGERFERIMESEEEHTKELTRQLEEEVKMMREKAERYKNKLQKSNNELEQLKDTLSREQMKTRDRDREVDRLMRMVEDERASKEKAVAEMSREDMLPSRTHEQIVADIRHQAAMQLEERERMLDEQWKHRLDNKMQQQKNETSKAMDRIRDGVKDLDKQKDELKRENGQLKEERRQLQEHITTLAEKLEKVDQQRQRAERKIDEVTDELEKNKSMYTVEMNRGLQYQGEVSRLQRMEHRQGQEVDGLKAEVLRLRQTHSDAEKVLQDNSRLKGEVASLRDTVMELEHEKIEYHRQLQALQRDGEVERTKSFKLNGAARTAVTKLDDQARRLRSELLTLRSDTATIINRTSDWVGTRLRELASEYGSATHLQLTRHAVLLKDMSTRLEESKGRAEKLKEELEASRASVEEKSEELTDARSRESALRSEISAAREHIAGMVGMMDRIIKIPEKERMGEELADALGKSDSFRHVLSRYDGLITRRITAMLREAQGEADSLAASCIELDYRCKKAEAELKNQTSMRSSLETMATERSVELEAALERERLMEARCKEMVKSAEDAQVEFNEKIAAAVKETKDVLRAEIDELQTEMLQLRRHFEEEVIRVSEEAAHRTAAFKRRCEERFKEEQKSASSGVETAARQKERLEKEKDGLREQLHVVEKDLSRVLEEKRELANEVQSMRRALDTAEKHLEDDKHKLQAREEEAAKLSQRRSSEVSRLKKALSEQNEELEHLKGQARKARESRDSLYRMISQTAGRHGIDMTKSITGSPRLSVGKSFSGSVVRSPRLSVSAARSPKATPRSPMASVAAEISPRFTQSPVPNRGNGASRMSPRTPPRRARFSADQPPRSAASLSHSVALSAGRSEISRAVSVQLDKTRRTLEQLKSADRSSRRSDVN